MMCLTSAIVPVSLAAPIANARWIDGGNKLTAALVPAALRKLRRFIFMMDHSIKIDWIVVAHGAGAQSSFTFEVVVGLPSPDGPLAPVPPVPVPLVGALLESPMLPPQAAIAKVVASSTVARQRRVEKSAADVSTRLECTRGVVFMSIHKVVENPAGPIR